MQTDETCFEDNGYLPIVGKTPDPIVVTREEVTVIEGQEQGSKISYSRIIVFNQTNIYLKCSVNFMYIQALESNFHYPIIVVSQLPKQKAIISIGRKICSLAPECE